MSKPRRKYRSKQERERLLMALANPVPPGGIGPRVISIPRELLAVDPSGFRCTRLAMQLADEWVEYVAATAITSHARTYHMAINRLCEYVDKKLGPEAEAVGLADQGLFDLLIGWELSLPETYAPSSTYPAVMAAGLRLLVVRRDDHSDRDVAPDLARWARGPALLAGGEKTERDEFTRPEKRALIRAAWQSVHATRKRLDEGWALAEQGQHPNAGSWTSIADLLCGLAHEQITPDDIRRHIPPSREWPPELQAFAAAPGRALVPQSARQQLVRQLFARLYPHTMDLHAFRVLLMDATGYTSEEVTGFGEKQVEFLPKGVRLTLLKNRARLLRHRAFRDQPASADELEPQSASDHQITMDWPRREASAVVRQLLETTARVRAKAPHVTDTLFVTGAVSPSFTPEFGKWDPQSRRTFAHWLDAMGIEIKGDRNIGRLRKSVKVEKAIVTEGRISDAADDHTEEAFAGHYAQGTTLRILSGRTITTAQQHWFDKALDCVDGPTVVPDVSAAVDSDLLKDTGLSAEEAEAIMSGQLDMGVSHCKNPYQGPYSRPGELCAVAPLRCLECRNAWILPSNLPQLLLFQRHLERLRTVLAPPVFARLWGQSWVNLRAVLKDRTPEDIALALKHIEAGQAVLDLPLAANTEFDA
ncbi:hypothetical protein [Saccharopolyspora hattusasensis]|uniref:hypothetical protein n=1 Tax=Saccharopolyspora hattusasensis TaxID=1128679 RepID=UPI003D977464